MKALLLSLFLVAAAEIWTPDGGYSTATLLADGGVSVPGAMVLDASGSICTCSSGSSCRVRGPDGGLTTAPLGTTLQGATGSGCVTKPCVELWGQSSWPYDSCPCPAQPADGGHSGC